MCGPTCTNCRSHLLIVNPPRVVDGQDEVRHAANVEGVEHGSNGHADDGQPHLSNILQWPSSKANAQHVGYGLEECPRVYCSKTGTFCMSGWGYIGDTLTL